MLRFIFKIQFSILTFWWLRYFYVNFMSLTFFKCQVKHKLRKIITETFLRAPKQSCHSIYTGIFLVTSLEHYKFLSWINSYNFPCKMNKFRYTWIRWSNALKRKHNWYLQLWKTCIELMKYVLEFCNDE